MAQRRYQFRSTFDRDDLMNIKRIINDSEDGSFGIIKDTVFGDLPEPYVRSAPLFLHDLLDHNIPEWVEFMGIRTDESPFAKDYDHDLIAGAIRDANTRRRRHPTKHTLLQSNGRAVAVEVDGAFFTSGCCIHCNHHFTIRAKRDPSGAQCKCPDRHEAEGVHLLSFLGAYSQSKVDADASEEYPLLTGAHFACTGNSCNFALQVEVSAPRLRREWFELLTDTDRIDQRLKRAQEEDPQRFSDALPTWSVLGLSQLQTYVRDLLEETEPKKLSKRNKRFYVVMGPETYPLFRFLRYEEISTEGASGKPEEYFVQNLPEPDDVGIEPGKRRALYEAVRQEVSNQIWRRHNGRLDGLAAALADRMFETALECSGYSFIATAYTPDWPFQPSSDPTKDSANLRPFRFLGTMPDFSTQLLRDTYERRRQADSDNHACYLDALYCIVRDKTLRHNSLASDVRPFIASDYAEYWGLEHGELWSDDEIITAIKNKVRNEPAGADVILNVLDAWTRGDRRSARLRKLLDEDLPLDFAFDILGARADDNPKQLMLNAEDRATKLDKHIVLRALRVVAESRQDRYLLREFSRLQDGDPSPDLPVGLENIGNTCYLNSILQYLYTIVPIHHILNNYSECHLSEEELSTRRVGASRSEVRFLDLVVSREFIKELQALFDRLAHISRGPTRPAQALANAVLLSDAQLQEGQPKQGLPVKTQKGPPPRTETGNSSTINAVDPDVDMVGGGLAATGTAAVDTEQKLAHAPGDIADTVSDNSSQTLLGDFGSDQSYEKIESAASPDAMDIDSISDPQTNLDRDTRTSSQGSNANPEALAKAIQGSLCRQHEFSMQQQDVEEIFGKIIERLQGAIRPNLTVDGIQIDPVMELMFLKKKTYTVETGRPIIEETQFYRYLTAFPSSNGPCTLYQALDRDLGRENLEGDKQFRYAEIFDPPPLLLHILVQRTQTAYEKNRNPVILDEVLYLDRWMEAGEGSRLLSRRRLGWQLQNRLSSSDFEVSNGLTVPENRELGSPALYPSIPTEEPEDVDLEDGWIRVRKDHPFSRDGDLPTSQRARPPEHTEVTSHDTTRSHSDVPLRLSSSSEAKLSQMLIEEQVDVKSSFDALFENMTKYAYKLHAVFCHSGSGKGGHYWVWIRDFEAEVWRKYNDTAIEVKKEILEDLNKSGDPYFLCYVREHEIDSLVRVPKREPREASTGPEENPPGRVGAHTA